MISSIIGFFFIMAEWENYEPGTGLGSKDKKVRLAALSVMEGECHLPQQHLNTAAVDLFKSLAFSIY